MPDKISINNVFLEKIILFIANNNNDELSKIVTELHVADIAEIIENIPLKNSQYLYSLINEEKAALDNTLEAVKNTVKETGL